MSDHQDCDWPSAGGEAPAARRCDKVPACHVVIIEDNADIRDALQLFLEADGHRVEVAEDGHDGVQRVLDTRPEVVLVDIGLPGLDGYAVARPGIFLAALTGYGQADDRARASEAGFDAHLIKPVTFEAVESLLRSSFLAAARSLPDPSSP
jgi:CheY-like chemotaxis protein